MSIDEERNIVVKFLNVLKSMLLMILILYLFLK